MNILIVTQYFWPETFRVNDLAAALVDEGHQVTVLTGYPNYPGGSIFREFQDNPSAFSAFAGARIVRVPMLGRGRGRISLALNYCTFALSGVITGGWKLRGENFDIVIGIALSPIFSLLPAAYQGYAKRAPLITWVFDLWPDSLVAVNAVNNKIILSMVGKFVSYIYDRSDLILAQSRSFVDSIANYTKNKNKIRYLPSWSEQEIEVPSGRQNKASRFVLLFAGNTGKAQDFPSILDAVSEVPRTCDFELWIAGDGSERENIANCVRERDLEDRVKLLGHRPLAEMPHLFAKADALLLTLSQDPNISLTIPGKTQSYLAAGKPILGMIDGEAHRIIVEAEAGLAVGAGDSRGLALNIQTMASLPDKHLSQMGLRGRAYYLREFSRVSAMKKLQEYMSLAKSEFDLSHRA